MGTMKLHGKRALVSGGSRGIGLAIAEALAREGAAVCITARDTKVLERSAKQLSANGSKIIAQACDVRNEAAVKRLAESIKRELGGLDYLINNAGYAGAITPVIATTLEGWSQTLETNLTGLMLMCRELVPLVADDGTIVNNLSIAAKDGFAGMAAYCASKAGALAFTNVLREELRGRRIRVVGLIPGATETDIWQQFWPDAPRENMLAPATVGELVAHLCTLPKGATVDYVHIGPVSGRI
jgi:NAD(P)-dependent dehydrogenase (short-subunit alcohol dehydrogenase family)